MNVSQLQYDNGKMIQASKFGKEDTSQAKIEITSEEEGMIKELKVELTHLLNYKWDVISVNCFLYYMYNRHFCVRNTVYVRGLSSQDVEVTASLTSLTWVHILITYLLILFIPNGT